MTDAPDGREPRPAGPPPPARPAPVPAAAGRPVPVRESVTPERVELPDPEPARRDLRVDDETWIVEVGGMGLSGARTDASATVLLLTFRREDEEAPSREALCVYPGLDAIPETRLEALILRAEPFRGSGTRRSEGEMFEATRRRREPRGG